MDELMKLCLKDDNLVLLDDLNKALSEATSHLVQELLGDIDVALKEEAPDLPAKADNTGRDLHFPLGGGASLVTHTTGGIGRLLFGVMCGEPERYEALRKALENVNGGGPTVGPTGWLWIHRSNLKVRNPTPKDLIQLKEPNRKEHAKDIARTLKSLWEAAKAAGLAG